MVAEWISNYLIFADGAAYDELVDSYRDHRDIWQSLPELVVALVSSRR